MEAQQRQKSTFKEDKEDKEYEELMNIFSAFVFVSCLETLQNDKEFEEFVDLAIDQPKVTAKGVKPVSSMIGKVVLFAGFYQLLMLSRYLVNKADENNPEQDAGQNMPDTPESADTVETGRISPAPLDTGRFTPVSFDGDSATGSPNMGLGKQDGWPKRPGASRPIRRRQSSIGSMFDVDEKAKKVHQASSAAMDEFHKGSKAVTQKFASNILKINDSYALGFSLLFCVYFSSAFAKRASQHGMMHMYNGYQARNTKQQSQKHTTKINSRNTLVCR